MKEFEKQRTDDIKECRERVRGDERRVAVEESRGKEGLEGKERKSPRVFGPCLPSSFVPELRLFSWPSFSRFVHPWAQGRVRARARGKTRARKRERFDAVVEKNRREGGQSTAEKEKEGWQKRGREKEEEEKEEESADGAEGLDDTYGSPCNRRLRRRARARGFRRSLCVSGVPEGAFENEGSRR